MSDDDVKNEEVTEAVEAAEEAVEEAKEEIAEAIEAVEEASEAVSEVKDVIEEAPKVEEKKEEVHATPAKEEKKPEPTGKFKELVKTIEEMSVLELSELVKVLEERFGVSAASPMMMGAMPAAGGAAPEAAEEKSAYNVVITNAGGNKISVIKAVREILPELGLKEAKDLVDAAPATLKENMKKEDAEAAKAKLTEAGATVELQ
jgi:large subunit ribosomal protein L7/L12